MPTKLVAPLASFATQTLATVSVDGKRLFRISRYSSNEPFFGHIAGNRFDDPKGMFGTCYVGFDLATAVAETVLHDELPLVGRFGVSQRDFEARRIVRFPIAGMLVVADFTGAVLKTTVGDSSLTTIFPYDLPQLWAAAVHAHPQKDKNGSSVDGMLYVSRQLNNRKAIVIFERAKPKLGLPSYELLGKSRSLRGVREILHIDYTMP